MKRMAEFHLEKIQIIQTLQLCKMSYMVGKEKKVYEQNQVKEYLVKRRKGKIWQKVLFF